ncbi:MAG: paraslipin [Rickettsiales bacterium]|jgi:regulator of protease activity HflC (stomatin/prohibitin superfamily)|nr:paraslipin [Rickettsiales bacterium]
MEIFLALGLLALILVFMGVKTVPQQQAWIVESFGKFDSKLEPGINFLIPFYQKVAYKHSLKEMAVDVPEQAGITRDNVTLNLDGVLYIRITDPIAASYGVSDPIYAVQLLAQTTMRSEIGKLTLDKTFEERETLNANIVTAINQAAQSWGVQCMRYEIKNITPPNSVLKAMELQMAADRQKRATILESEGKRQAQINVAEGLKQEVVLKSEGALTDQVNRAKGEAEAILAVAEATAKGIDMVSQSIMKSGGSEAVALKIAEQYVGAFKELAKESTTVLMPMNAGDAGGMVAQALTVFDAIRNKTSGNLKEGAKGPWGAQ